MAKQQLYENTSDPQNGWEQVAVGYERIVSCYSKCYCLDKEKNEVFVTKAVGRIPADPSLIVDVYWNVNEEQTWNAATILSINIVEDRGNEQLIYQQHKTNSAATSKNDVSYRRIKSRLPDGSFWIYSVSEITNPETRNPFRRGWVVFGGLLVEPGDGACQVSFVWCWDFNGWIHEKFVVEEKKRVALRLSKIGSQVAELQRNPRTNTSTKYTQAPPTSSASTPATTTYTSTSASIAQQAPSKPPAQEGTLRGCKECRIPESGNYCSRCGNPTSSVCGRCFSTTLYSGANCSNCGNKLRDLPSE